MSAPMVREVRRGDRKHLLRLPLACSRLHDGGEHVVLPARLLAEPPARKRVVGAVDVLSLLALLAAAVVVACYGAVL